jgi:hypothetical protein
MTNGMYPEVRIDGIGLYGFSVWMVALVCLMMQFYDNDINLIHLICTFHCLLLFIAYIAKFLVIYLHSQLITRPDIKIFLPPIGGLTIYIWGKYHYLTTS